MANELIPLPHLGERLRKYVKEKRIYQAGWARVQGIKPLAVARFLKKPSLQLSILFTICQVLKYNFIREIADQLPPEFPPHATNPLQQQVDQLQEENKILKEKLALMKEVVGVRGGG